MSVIYCVDMIHDGDRFGPLAELDTATLYEAAGQRGALSPAMRPLYQGIRLAGPAKTVLCPPGDNLSVHEAVVQAAPGDVLVIQCCDREHGVWGDVLTVAATARGVAGLVIDGGVRDVNAIRTVGFPVFSTAVAIRATVKAVRGAIDVPISCAGEVVWPGDIVVGDDTGVVVIRQASYDAVVEAAQARRVSEERMKEALRGGETTWRLLKLDQKSRGDTRDSRKPSPRR